MRAVDLIEKKKRGGELTPQELTFLVKGFTAGQIPDYQLSAWSMAVYFQGMTARETAALTTAMAQSGDQVDLSSLGPCTVDKHSTGGVGDKTTLIVAPIVASLGGIVAKMSGRGLGHTGGTVDKLESIPGYRTELTADEFMQFSKEIGVVVAGQSGNLATADKKLYALRDVTATVDSIPLIASSIMSKKIAAGAQSIVLDVKCGSGAFMKTPEEAAALAQEMVRIGRSCGRRMAAFITNMDRPLGNAIGNALEVQEALAVLQGQGPGDLKEVCLALAAEMLALCHGWSGQEALQKATDALADGRALAKMKEWITCQGGDLYSFEIKHANPPVTCKDLLAPADGYIRAMNAEKIGIAAMLLGAGRATKADSIDYDAGIVLEKKTGDRVQKGAVIARLYATDPQKLDGAQKAFMEAVEIGQQPPRVLPMIHQKIGGVI